MSAAGTDVLLEVSDLSVDFHTDAGVVAAVDRTSFSIRRGETLCLVGESGCGKTVTSLAILRLIPDPPGRVREGRVMFEGIDLLRVDEAEILRIRGNRIGMIFQEPMSALNPVYRVGTQVAEGLRLHKGMSAGQAAEETVELFRQVGIPDPDRRAREYPHQLSGGMQQRVMIAMALACRPSLLIADEPTTALDVTIQAQILSLIADLKKQIGAATLLITHDLGVVAEVADKAAVMYTGRIVESAPVRALFRDPQHPYTQGLMASVPNIDQPLPERRRLNAIPGVVPSLTRLPSGCAFRDRCPAAFGKCAERVPPAFAVTDDHHVRCWLHER